MPARIDARFSVLQQARLARECGLEQFVPTTPCSRGHWLRSAYTGDCHECKRNRPAVAIRKNTPVSPEQKEKNRLYAAEYRKNYPEKARAGPRQWHRNHPSYVAPSRRK